MSDTGEIGNAKQMIQEASEHYQESLGHNSTAEQKRVDLANKLGAILGLANDISVTIGEAMSCHTEATNSYLPASMAGDKGFELLNDVLDRSDPDSDAQMNRVHQQDSLSGEVVSLQDDLKKELEKLQKRVRGMTQAVEGLMGLAEEQGEKQEEYMGVTGEIITANEALARKL